MTDSIQTPIANDCLGRTCLKWGSDGELTALDLCLVLERLAQVDQEMTALQQGTLAVRPCPSIS
jgi:hypothetical protein